MRNNLKTVTPLLHFALCIFLIIFLSACGEAIYSSSETGSIAFSLELQGSPNEISGFSQAIDCADSGVSTVEAKVYDEDGALIANGGPWDCIVHSGTITSVPPGSNRKVVILGKDASGSVLYSGALAGITVTAGQTTPAGEIIISVQDQVWHISDDFPSDFFIPEKGGLGYRITSMAYGGGMWAVVMSLDTGYTDQWWATNLEFLAIEEFIIDKWGEGYRITDLAYGVNFGENVWAVVVSPGTGYTDQVWHRSVDFPIDYISEQWALGFEITSLAYGEGMWAVVMSTETGYMQAWATRLDFPTDYINEQWALDKRITSLTYGVHTGENVWAVVLSTETGYTDQMWATRIDFSAAEDFIYHKWDEGYHITGLAYGVKAGENVWAVVISK